MFEKVIKKLLDDYYGNSRTDEHKREIADFIRNYSSDLLELLKYNDYE